MPNTGRERPYIFVLAGVNGAGKSSIGGAMLRRHGLDWFNPDTYARELLAQYDLDPDEASSIAWHASCSRLETAIADQTNYAFETTLGANTVRELLKKAAQTHDVIMFFCGLESPDAHIRRVQLRVAHGGHSIREEKIRERWVTSRINVVALMPHLTQLQLFDNSIEAAAGQAIPYPALLLKLEAGRILVPELNDSQAMLSIPDWAKPIVQAAIESQI